MKRKLFFLGILILISVVIYLLFSQSTPVKVKVSVRPRSALIGDTIKCSFVVSAGANTQIRFPEIKNKLDDFEVKEIQSFETTSFRKKITKVVYSLTAYKPGLYEVPEIEILYRDGFDADWESMATRKVSIRIKKLVKVDLLAEQRLGVAADMAGMRVYGAERQKGNAKERFIDAPIRYYIHDVKSPAKIITYKDIIVMVLIMIAGGGGLLFLGFFVIGIIRLRSEEVPLSIDEEITRKLKQLKFSKLPKNGLNKEFCTELSAILMTYIKKRFNLGSQENTTREFIEKLEEIGDMTKEQKDFIKERIEICDLVKYSNYESDAKDLDPKLEKEIDFVRSCSSREDDDL